MKLAYPHMNTEPTDAKLVGKDDKWELKPPLMNKIAAERDSQNLMVEQQAIRKCSVFLK